MMLNNAFNHCEANSVTVAPWHTKSCPRMMDASKASRAKNLLDTRAVENEL